MNDRPRIQRALLRRALRKQIRQSTTEELTMLELTLDDEVLFETAYETSMVAAQKFGTTSGTFSVTFFQAEPIVDNLLKLLQWFITQAPALIEMIEQLIGLFGNVAVARDVCDDEVVFVV